MYKIIDGYTTNYKAMSTFAWIWVSLSSLLLMLRILTLFRKKGCCASSGRESQREWYEYRSSSPFRQIMYAVTLVLYNANIFFSFYWKYSPTHIVLACCFLIILDLLVFMIEIVDFCLLLSDKLNAARTEKQIQNEQKSIV